MRALKFVSIAIFALCSVRLSAQTAPLYSYSVPTGGYAHNGNLTNYSDSITGTWSNQYDGLNRLKSAASNSGPYNGLNIQWEYDSFGNRLSQIPAGSTANLPPATTMQYADGTNRITSSSIPGVDSSAYDAVGNLRFDGRNAIAYDAENRVCAVRNINGTVTQYLYNAEGQRVAKGNSASGSGLVCPAFGDFVPTEKYILGLSGEQITELRPQPDGSDVWQHTNVYANGELIATYDQEDSQLLHFHASDPLGSRRVQTSGSGVVELSFSNLPYGDGLNSTGSGQDATPHHFTGKERDTETGEANGNDYFGARYYGSTMGRFMSPDRPEDETLPVALPFADFNDPQTLNLYSYGLNNPVSYRDFDGHDVTLCANGSSDCTTIGDDQWAAIRKQIAAGNSGGVTVDGKGFEGTGTIMCGGSACGTATYFERGLEDASTPLLLGWAGGKLGGALLGAAFRGIAGMFSSGATTVATEATASTVGKMLLSGGTKAAAKDVLNGMAEGAQKAALKRAIARATTREALSITQNADGSVTVVLKRAGFDGFQSLVKTIDSAGNSSTVQLAYDSAGTPAHIHVK